MDLQEFFVQRWEAEQPAFGKVLRAMPADKLSDRKSARSTKAGDLAWQLAEEQRGMCDLLEKGEIVWEQRPRPASAADIVKAWDDSAEELRKRLGALSADKAAGPAKFVMGGQAVWTDTVGNMLWGFLFDMIHHRGQLSTYLRPMGGKVPSIYGPSADDKGE
jgi:DinB family.